MKIEAIVCAYWWGLTGLTPRSSSVFRPLPLRRAFTHHVLCSDDSVMERLFDGSPDRPIDWLSYWLFVKVMN